MEIHTAIIFALIPAERIGIKILSLSELKKGFKMASSYKRIIVCVPASTSNLGPGFDVVGLALKLHNTVEIEERGRKLKIEIEGEGSESISREENNLVYKAMRLVFQKARHQVRGLKIHIHNKIPLGSGLGSSGATTIAGMLGGNEIMGRVFSNREILNIATEIEGHPDNVTPCLFGGFTVSSRVDDRVIYFKVKPPRQLKAMVVIPKYPISTKKARESLPDLVPRKDAVFNIGRTGLLVIAFCKGRWELLEWAMEDRLHQEYRTAFVPSLFKIINAAKAAGALGCVLSGAGPSIIALALKNYEDIIESMTEEYSKDCKDFRRLILDIDNKGARVMTNIRRKKS